MDRWIDCICEKCKTTTVLKTYVFVVNAMIREEKKEREIDNVYN